MPVRLHTVCGPECSAEEKTIMGPSAETRIFGMIGQEKKGTTYHISADEYWLCVRIRLYYRMLYEITEKLAEGMIVF